MRELEPIDKRFLIDGINCLSPKERHAIRTLRRPGRVPPLYGPSKGFELSSEFTYGDTFSISKNLN